MKYQQLVINFYEKLSQEIDMLLDGLTVEDLNKKPAEDANPIGWLLWHPTRGMDRAFADITGQAQLWVQDEWYKKFGRDPNPPIPDSAIPGNRSLTSNRPMSRC